MSQSTDQNKAVYNRIAKHFSATRNYLWKDILQPAFVRYITPGCHILDVGCGNGRLSQLFAGLDVTYAGLDQSEALIALARKQHPGYSFIESSMTGMPLPDASYDLLYCVAAFHHLTEESEQRAALQEMARVLRPGGRIIMLNWNLEGAWAKGKLASGAWKREEAGQVFFVPWRIKEGAEDEDRVYYSFTPDALAKLAADAGLAVEEQGYTRHGSPSNETEGENILSVLSKPLPPGSGTS